MQDKPIINPLGQPFIELESVDSTNNYALAGIRQGVAQHGCSFFAHEQTAGKGQRGRQWSGEKGGNIALSVVLHPKPLLIPMQFQLSACIAVAVCKFFSRYAGDDTRIKWPNDLYWKDRKAGGILIENIISGKQDIVKPEHGVLGFPDSDNISSEWKWAVAGIGININQTRFPADLPNPVSLKQITGKDYSAVQLARELCVVSENCFNKLINEGFEPVYKEYINCLYKLNDIVRLRKENRVFLTAIKGVSKEGELITEQKGLEERFGFGEVRWEQ